MDPVRVADFNLVQSSYQMSEKIIKQCHSNLMKSCQVGKAVELKKVLDFAVHPPNVLVETFFDQAGLFQDLAVHMELYTYCIYDYI